MMPLIKICGLSDVASVDAAVDAGADALGFVFAESVRRVKPQNAVEIAAHLPAHIRKVAVMLHPTAAQWQQVRSVFQPDILQTDRADFAHLEVPEGIGRWPVLREGRTPANDAWPDVFVYEGGASGKGQRVDWRLAAQHARRGKMLLAGGLDSDNVAEAIDAVLPFGVDVSSGVESAPGNKDVGKIRTFIQAVRAAGSTDEEGDT